MSQKSRTAARLGGSPDDLENAFYEALRQGDLDRVMACWADEDEICCVHPGGGRLVGAAAIRASYAALLERGGLPLAHQLTRRVHALACAMHSVIERIDLPAADGAAAPTVVASHVFIKTASGWRLVLHHASVGAAEGLQAPAGGGVLH